MLRGSRFPRQLFQGSRSLFSKWQLNSKDTYSVPVPLILNREYILIKTTMVAMVASVQTIASNDPRLFWSPPLGMGSEAIGIVAHVGNEAEKNRTKNMRKERKDSRTI